MFLFQMNAPPQLACKLTYFRSHGHCMENESYPLQITYYYMENESYYQFHITRLLRLSVGRGGF